MVIKKTTRPKAKKFVADYAKYLKKEKNIEILFGKTLWSMKSDRLASELKFEIYFLASKKDP